MFSINDNVEPIHAAYTREMVILQEKSDSDSLGRGLTILGLFDFDRPRWSAEAICEALALSKPTAYRYLRNLREVGLLLRLTGGSYVLGPRVIELDYTIRRGDPLLRAALPAMRALTARTGADVVLSALFGRHVLDTHHEAGATPLTPAYGRGRPRPLFHGAAPKVLLAAQPVRWLQALHADFGPEIAQAGLGDDWTAFRRTLAAIEAAGSYVSRGETEPGLVGVAVPIPGTAAHPTSSALALVGKTERFELFNIELIQSILSESAHAIARDVAAELTNC